MNKGHSQVKIRSFF